MSVPTAAHKAAHGEVPPPRDFTATVRATRGKGMAGLIHITLEWLKAEAAAGHPEALTDHMWLWSAPGSCGARAEHARAELGDELERRIPQLRTLRAVCGLYGMSERSVKAVMTTRAVVWAAWIWQDEAAYQRLAAYPL